MSTALHIAGYVLGVIGIGMAVFGYLNLLLRDWQTNPVADRWIILWAPLTFAVLLASSVLFRLAEGS